MRRQAPSAVSRLSRALAMTLALACAPVAGAHAQAAARAPYKWAPPLPSGGAAAAHAHPGWKPPSAAQLQVPVAPPPPPVIPAPIVVPMRPPPPPTPTPVEAGAPGGTEKTADGLRLTFGTDHADLNPAAAAAVTALARDAMAHAAPGADAVFTVTGFAVGGDDPSMPRRLSLSRALAVRSALMQAGVASVHIYVRALGASLPAITAGPADRVDIVVGTGPGPAQPVLAVPPPPPPPAAALAPNQKAAP